jgi:Fe-S cluster assembly protein SufD
MKQEEWRFTSTAPIAETPFALSNRRANVALTSAEVQTVRGTAARAARVIFVDGAFAPELSAVGDLPPRVHAGSLAAALKSAPDLTRSHLAHYAPYQASPFAALNTAFLADGAFVFVPAGVQLDRPIELTFVASASGDPAVSHPRTLVVVERGAHATVIESYVTLQDGLYWTNAVTEIAVGAGAHLEHYRVQRESRQAYHVATTHTAQHRDSTLRLHPITLGARLARHDIYTALEGTGADLVLNGFYLLRGKQHADHHTVIDHAQPHCTSHEFFNGILGEQAHGVFTGRIIVRPGAQRTDSKQTNNNLLLSAEARADSQPQLEIYADDVKCTHGSTMGPLDEMALYYLRSRGLSPEMAAGMLTYGFAAEILGRMEHAELRQELDQVIRARLAERSPGGRRA